MVREDLNIKKKKKEHNTYSQHLLSLPFSPYILMRVYIRVYIFYVLANTYPPHLLGILHMWFIFFLMASPNTLGIVTILLEW